MEALGFLLGFFGVMSMDEHLSGALARRVGADPGRTFSRDVRDSLPMFPRIEGNQRYLDRLDDTARALHRDLRKSETVQTAVGKPVTVADRPLGKLKPFSQRSVRARVDALKHLLHSLAHIASRPVLSTGERLSYVAIPMANETFGTGTEYGHLQRDAFRQIVLALLVYSPSVAGAGWLEYRPAYHNRETGQGGRTRVAANRPMLDWMTRQQLVFPYHPHGPKAAPATPALLRLKLREDGDPYDSDPDEGQVVTLDRPLDPEEDVLPSLNRRLARQRLSCPLHDYAEYERHFDFSRGQPPTLGGRSGTATAREIVDEWRVTQAPSRHLIPNR